MIYDVTQMGKFRAAKGKRDVAALCQEVGLDYSLYEGDMVSVHLEYDEQLIQRDANGNTMIIVDNHLRERSFRVRANGDRIRKDYVAEGQRTVAGTGNWVDTRNILR